MALGLIAGLAAGMALAAVAGARRTGTVYERFRKATAAPDALVFATQLGIYNQDYSAVLRLPEVLDGGTFNLSPVGIVGLPMGTLSPGDTHLYRTFARPLLVSGRLPNPQRDDEIVVNRLAAARFHLHVGQRRTLSSSTNQADFYVPAVPTGGPTVEATIVGIGDSALDAIFFGAEPGFIPSGGFLAKHPEVPRVPNLVVRLRPGTDVSAFHRRAAAALGLPDIPVRDLAQDRKRTIHGTDLERTGLLLFALSALIAGIVLIGQALTRTVYAMAEPASALRALGFTKRDLVAGLVLSLGTTAVTAAAATVVSAFTFSERFPVGLGRRLEPDVGFHSDWSILAPGALLVVVLVLAGATLASHRSIRETRPRPAPSQRSAVLQALRRKAPLPVAIGAGLALEGGRGPRSLPVRPALGGAVAGVLGVIGALGLVHGIDDALARPARSGQVWDAIISPTEEFHGAHLIDSLKGERDVQAIAELDRAPLDVDGDGLPVYALRPVRGDLSFVVLRGRSPKGPDEAAIGPASAKGLRKTVGDSVVVASGSAKMTLRIVGIALLPQTPHSEFDQGVWTTKAGLGKVDDRSPEERDREVLVTARPGVKSAALVSQLGERYSDVSPANSPQDVLVLRNVRTLPRALALFLVLLGLAALGHALVTAVRRRSHDLAVLRALGFRPRQNAACIFSQAGTIALVGLVLGVPLGAVAGRLAWRRVADSTPLLYVAPIAAVAIALAVPAALVAANVLAALPARRAARLRPVDVLRSE